MKNSERAQQVFAEELSWIMSDKIRQFVLDAFDRFGHEFFWFREASLSGKHHPAVSQGQQGLVRHTRLVAWWGREFTRAYLIPKNKMRKQESIDKLNKYGDHVIAACLLHDAMKEGDPTLASLPERMGHGGNSLVNGCHGVDLANAILNRMLGGKPDPDQILILFGIACHMGQWTLPVEYCPNAIQGELARAVAQVVSMADYTASRNVADQLTKLGQELPGQPA